MSTPFTAGRDFIIRQGRVLDRRLFATCFEGAPATGVTAALRGYRNDDGGFGHGLEPDKRCPASLPIDVEIALGAMATAGPAAADPELIQGACDYLAGVAKAADSDGAVPPAFPVIEDYPRAAHWTDWTYAPGLNPTAGLVGLLHRLGAEHLWIEAGAAYCWDKIDSGEVPAEAHAMREVLLFLEYAPDRERADAVIGRVYDQLLQAAMFQLDPADSGYGLSPLAFAPAADSRWRGLFPDGVIDAHLDVMAADQQDDGGWPIRWDPPSEASLLDWRGMVTLDNLRTLTSYGRLAAGA